MGISDVLFEARERILDQLAVYEREDWPEIAALVLTLDKMRLSVSYDIIKDLGRCAGRDDPMERDDSMEYLNQLLAERRRRDT